MLDRALVLVGAGPLPELRMRHASEALAAGWGCPLLQLGCGEDPNPLLAAVSKAEPVLLRLAGDPALELPGGSHWLEALAAWRMPTLMLAAVDGDGPLSGTVPAYAALATALAVPLVGIVQIGGAWRPERRRRDGLPWCGAWNEADPEQAALLLERLRIRLQGLGSASQRELPST